MPENYVTLDLRTITDKDIAEAASRARQGGVTWIESRGRRIAAVVPADRVKRRRHGVPGRPRSTDTTDDEVIKAYTVDRMSLRACSGALGITPKTVAAILERNGIPRRGRGRSGV